MKKWLLASSLLVAGAVQGAGMVDYLEVENDVVLFSTTEAKTGSRPVCVDADSETLWSVSLDSESGRTMYSLLLTSMVKGNTIGLAIESAEDCANMAGIERAAKVNVNVSAGNTSGSNTKSVGVYRGDGVRLGTLSKANASYIQYYDGSKSILPKHIDLIANMVDMFFESNDCSGTPYVRHRNGMVANINWSDGGFFQSSNTRTRITKGSFFKKGAGCHTARNQDDLYEVLTTPQTHEICGSTLCYVRED